MLFTTHPSKPNWACEAGVMSYGGQEKAVLIWLHDA